MPITVNGAEISDAAIRAEMAHHPAPNQTIAEFAAKLELIARELLRQEADRLGIVGHDTETRIAALIEREVGNPVGKADQPHAMSQYLAKLLGQAAIDGMDFLNAAASPAGERK